MTEKNLRKYSSKNWFPIVLAGLLPGFLLSVGLTGLLLRYGFGEVGLFSIYGQFLMWLISPLWVAILSLSFLFRTPLSAWLCLGTANVVVWLLVYGSRVLQG